MLTSTTIVLLCTFFIPFILAQGPTKIYIDALSQYSSLATCARNQLNNIVKQQSSGCGNSGSETKAPYTSFACFCFTSSARFDTIISIAVAEQCQSSTNAAASVSSALDVFSRYCAQGTSLTAATTPGSTSPTQMAAPAATASGATSTSSSSPSSSEVVHSDSLSGGEIAGVVIGAVAGAGLLLGAAVMLVVWRRRKARAGPVSSVAELEPKGVHEMDATTQAPVEVSGEVLERAELPGQDGTELKHV